MKKLLLVEPDSLLADTIVAYIKNIGTSSVDITSVSSGQEAVSALSIEVYDAVVMEHDLKTHNCIELLYEFRSYSEWQTVPVIVFSSMFVNDSILNGVTWQQLNIFKYLYKPQTHLFELNNFVQKALAIS